MEWDYGQERSQSSLNIGKIVHLYFIRQFCFIASLVVIVSMTSQKVQFFILTINFLILTSTDSLFY
jgi:hypothetical protein